MKFANIYNVIFFLFCFGIVFRIAFYFAYKVYEMSALGPFDILLMSIGFVAFLAARNSFYRIKRKGGSASKNEEGPRRP